MKASKLVQDLEKDGWRYDGHDGLELRDEEIDNDKSLSHQFEYQTLTISLKRKRDNHG